MKAKNIIAIICGVILIASMAAGLPVFAAETAVNYVDLDGDGKINEAESQYAEALAAMANYQKAYNERLAAGYTATEEALPGTIVATAAATTTELTTDLLPTVDDATAKALKLAEMLAALPLWDGTPLTKGKGATYGPSGKEVYYNLDMAPVAKIANDAGYPGAYWIREDGAKMLGDYIMVAASYEYHPFGSLIQTSMGTGIVVDTGAFATENPQIIDIATSW